MVLDLYEKEDCLKMNNFYKKLFEEIPDLIFQFIVSRNNDFFFPIISKSISEILELSSEDFNDNGVFALCDRLLQEEKDDFVQSFISARKSLIKWEHEFRVLLPKRGERWLKVSAKPELCSDGDVTFYGRISDITDIKNRELNLKVSEVRFQFALEASTSGIWDWDMKTNKVFYSSQSMKILELESTDVFDNPERWDKMVHPDDLGKYYSDIQNHFDNKTSYYENFHRVLTSSGTYKWILNRGKVVEWDIKGKPLRVVGIHADVSTQKEKELQMIKAMQLYSEQNGRLLNFSHIVSHNLKTHAGNIKSLLDVIDDEKNIYNREKMMKYLRVVSDDLSSTIVNLTQIVDIQNNFDIIIRPLNLNYYLKKTLELLNVYANDNKIVVINNIPEDAEVNFNPAYLESVLLNFTTNAIKYAHPDRFPVIKFDFSVDDNGVKILTIADNGLGIDLEKYGEELFGMYKTFHKHKLARGVGLYITKNQIESMKGEVAVESIVGEGTAFKIIFNNANNKSSNSELIEGIQFC